MLIFTEMPVNLKILNNKKVVFAQQFIELNIRINEKKIFETVPRF